MTDAGNAKRFALQHAGHVRYCYAAKCWYVWTGTHWRRDPGELTMRLAKETAIALYTEAATAPSDEARKATAAWARKSEDAHRLQMMLRLAQSEPGIPVLPKDLDQDPWLLNCQNGTLDLRTDGTLRPHARQDLITRCLPISYDPDAPYPMFEQFLARIFAGQVDVIDFMQRAMGYALTGDTRERKLFLCWGTGDNGKTTLLQTVRALLAGYAVPLAADALLMKKYDTAITMNHLAALHGARFVVSAEANMGQHLAEALVKQLTGGEEITVKKLYADVYAIQPTFKLFIATNHRPVIRGTDHAIWRRIDPIPFDVQIPLAEQDGGLPGKLATEWPGILRWAVEGCRAWQQDGLQEPAPVRHASADYRAEMDTLGDFLAERCVVEPDASVASAELYLSYLDWAKQSGEHALPKKVLAQTLVERRFEPTRSTSSRRWQGLRLRVPMDAADEPGDASDNA